MSVTHSTIDLSTVSSTSFEDAINEGVSRATSTLRNVQGVWIKDMNVLIENGSITGYKVNMEVTFVLDEGQSDSDAPNERHEREAHRQPSLRRNGCQGLAVTEVGQARASPRLLRPILDKSDT